MPEPALTRIARQRLIDLISTDPDLLAVVETPIQVQDTNGAIPGADPPAKPVLCIVGPEIDVRPATQGGRGYGSQAIDITIAALVYKPAQQTRASQIDVANATEDAAWYTILAVLKYREDPTPGDSLWSNLRFRQPSGIQETPQTANRYRLIFDLSLRRFRNP